MIAAWMIASTVFAALLAVAAVAVDRALRTAGRQGRGAWLFALVGAVGWPALAPVAADLFARLSSSDARPPLAAADASMATITSALPAVSRSWVASLDAPLVILWAIASLLLLARLAWAIRTLSRMERAADRDVIDGVPVLVTRSTGPAVFGTSRARVLVPRWLLDLDAPLRELVLLHEQEHCRARDPQLTLAVAVALVLTPWNAGVWWIARRLRLAVELDCDARVLRGAHDTERYSKLLLFIAQRQSLVRLAPMLAESNSHLGRRIAAMHAPRPGNPRLRIACFLVVAAGALAYSTKFAAELAAAPTVSLSELSGFPRGALGPRTLAAPLAQQSVPTADTLRSAAPAKERAGVAKPKATPSNDSQPEIARGVAPVVPVAPVPPQQGVTGPGDRMVTAVPGLPAPRYPLILKQAGVEGGVLVAFVVDTNGVVDPRSIKFFVFTHELFAESVKAALPDMRFLPAIVNGVKVKQAVRMPIVFNLSSSNAHAAEYYQTVTEKLLSDPASSNLMALSPVLITGVVP